MSVKTLLKFLIGDREAILTIARTPQALWIGLLFVMGAALAREYDKESLLHEPWHLLLPLAASLLTSFVLFNMFYLLPRFQERRPPFFAAYRSFLQVFWMTAPMAWLYAIPWERILDSPGEAASANLWTLALVSAWRVLLITRVLSVLFNINAVGAFFIVMLYSHVAAYFAIASLPFSIIHLMGGVQLGESERAIAGIAGSIVFFGVLLVPLWFLGTLAAIGMFRLQWRVEACAQEQPRAPAPLGRLAVALIILGLALLPFTQPEQMRRHKAESLLKGGDIEAAIAFMSEHARADFPPHWDPPPRQGYFDRRPDVNAVAERIIEADVPGWVRETYVRKLHEQVHERRWRRRASWSELAQDPYWRPNSGMDRTLAALLALDASLSDDDRAAIETIIEHLREQDREHEQRRTVSR